MSQTLLPLNGGIGPVTTTPNPGQQSFLSPQYVQVKGLNPSPTEWVPGGRPIFGRLPLVYKAGFEYDADEAYVSIPTGFPNSGIGSLQALSSGDNKYLLIQSGKIVWKNGEVPLEPVIVDLKLVDLRSSRYFIGYQLYADDSPFEAQYSVEDFSLSGTDMFISSGTDSEPGWRYSSAFAFANSGSNYWSNYDSVFPNYVGEASLAWQTQYSNAFSSIKLRCPLRTAYTGTATLYYQVCPNSSPEEKFCAQPEWIAEQTVSVSSDSTGQYYEFTIANPSFQNGWKVEWSDSRVSIQSVVVSGTLTLLRKPVVPTTYCQLVAYPQNAIPTQITNLLGEKVPVTMCGLALVDIDNNYEITKLEDIREIVYGEYQPVADWLTKTWDENLINLQTQVKNFPRYWMNTQTCLHQEYLALEESLISVEK